MIALLGLGLLAAVGVYLVVTARMERRLRRSAARLERLEERGARMYEDVCWMVYRQSEAELAVDLWRRSWPGHVSGAVKAARNMSEAIMSFGVSVEQASARLNALLLALPPDRRV